MEVVDADADVDAALCADLVSVSHADDVAEYVDDVVSHADDDDEYGDDVDDNEIFHD